MRALLAALLLLVISPASAASLPVGGGYGAIDAPRDIAAVDLGRQFCAARLLDDMSRVSSHLAPKLEALLRGAAGEIPWQSFPDRPTNCEVAVLFGFEDTIGVLIEVSYRAPGRRWSDTLNLERTPDTWLINNVFYEGGGNLRFRLFEARPWDRAEPGVHHRFNRGGARP